MPPAHTPLAAGSGSRFIAQHGYSYVDEPKISQNLKCSICSEPWQDPVEAGVCKHIFCRRCIEEWTRRNPTCPIDRTALPTSAFAAVPGILSELVNELEVLCALGCGWVGRRDEYTRHLDEGCAEVEIGGVRRGGDRDVVAGSGKESPDGESNSGEDEWAGVSDNERELRNKVVKLQKEANDYQATIEIWKSKVIELEERLANALCAHATSVTTEPSAARSPTAGSSRSATFPDPSAAPPMQVHPAVCDSCGTRITGVRWKCLKCPDFDLCSRCHPSADTIHGPGHDFVSITRAGESRFSVPEGWRVRHPGVSCDHCGQDMVGPRYKCTVCADFDLCFKCIALPRQPHNIRHPFIRHLQPVSVARSLPGVIII